MKRKETAFSEKDIENIVPASSPSVERANNRQGIVTLIYSKDGKRIVLSKDLVQELVIKDKVKIGFLDEALIIGRELPNVKQSYPVKALSRGKKVIYSAQLTQEILERLKLDLRGGVSRTLYNITCIEWKNNFIAKITE